MAAPRATQFIALRNLARGSHQVRQLSMTGPKTFASPVLERPVLNLPHDMASLRAECKRRNIDPAGPKQELLHRLNAHDVSSARPFSSALTASDRPSASSAVPATARHFNTSRERKAIKDSSPLDFAFLPSLLSSDPSSSPQQQPRVPIIPSSSSSSSASSPVPQQQKGRESAVVMKPEINVMSADAVYLPMSESSDGHAMHVDFYALAEKVAGRLRVPVEERAGMARRVWGDMVDDVLGLEGGKRAAA